MDQQPRRRRRPALSCLPCRRRKIKCNRQNPCAHCVSAKLECSYRTFYDDQAVAAGQDSASSPSASPQPPAVSDGHSNAPTLSLRPTAGSPSASGQTVSIFTIGQGQYTGQETSHQEETREETRPGDFGQGLANLCHLIAPTQKPEESSSSSPAHGLMETGRHILSRQLGLPDSQLMLSKTRLLKWSHWMGMAPEFASVAACFNAANGDQNEGMFATGEAGQAVAAMGELLQDCKRLAKALKAGRPTRSLYCPDVDMATPPRELSDAMVAQYFQCFESAHRILHYPSFMVEYQSFWDSPSSARAELRLKILLVIGIGSSVSNHAEVDASFRRRVHQWVYAAQTWLSGPLEKDRVNLAGLQIHCLTILIRQVFSIGGDLIWVSMGSLLHRAMQVGLHRDPKHFPSMSLMQSELRRRLWATILEMVAQSSLDSAMPPRISVDEFDARPPANINDDEMDEFTTIVKPKPRDVHTSTSTQLLLLDSLPSRLRILHLLNGLHSELSYPDVLRLSSEVTDAYRANSAFMNKNQASSMTPFHRNLVTYLVRRFVIPLHCPFASQGRLNPLFHYSLKACVDTALGIIYPEPDDAYSRLMTSGGGTFREGIWYSASIISLELLVHIEAQKLDGMLHRDSRYRDTLKQAIKDIMAICVERIKLGETNIKTHMFLNVVLGQVEAIEAGTPCELKMAICGKESLAFCRDLVQEQVSGLSTPFNNDTGSVRSADLDFGFNSGSFGLDFDLDFFLPDADFS